jgi:hypothetical protein
MWVKVCEKPCAQFEGVHARAIGARDLFVEVAFKTVANLVA